MVQKLSKLIKICKKDVAKVLLLCFMDHSDYGFGLILYDVFDMSVTFIVHCYLLTYLLTYLQCKTGITLQQRAIARVPPTLPILDWFHNAIFNEMDLDPTQSHRLFCLLLMLRRLWRGQCDGGVGGVPILGSARIRTRRVVRHGYGQRIRLERTFCRRSAHRHHPQLPTRNTRYRTDTQYSVTLQRCSALCRNFGPTKLFFLFHSNHVYLSMFYIKYKQ